MSFQKRIVITLNVDLKTEGTSGVSFEFERSSKTTSYFHLDIKGDHNYFLVGRQHPELATQAIIAHELGHLVATVLEQPAQMRAYELSRWCMSPLLMKKVTMAAEKNAWRIGKEVFAGMRKACLRCYRDLNPEEFI